MSANHQTVRLAPGRHARPEQGACVMELASLLAGEPFSDHPACASPVLGAFLRTYNDLVDDDRRQTLYPIAAMVVGTRGVHAAETARGAACQRWATAVLSERGRSRWQRWRLARSAYLYRGMGPEDVARGTARLAATLTRQDGDAGHARVLAFIEQLVGERGVVAPPAAAVAEGEPLAGAGC